jgi:hypothetical protein
MRHDSTRKQEMVLGCGRGPVEYLLLLTCTTLNERQTEAKTLSHNSPETKG